MRWLIILALVLSSGCASERRLVLLRQAKIGLRHAVAEPGWTERLDLLRANIDEEIHDADE